MPVDHNNDNFFILYEVTMASTSSGIKRAHKENYSQEEKLFLVDIYEEFNEVLDSQMKSVSTKQRKNEAWNTIVRRHEARFPKTRRTVDELRIKISKIKSDAKDYLSKTKKSRAKTGGGPSSPNKIDQMHPPRKYLTFAKIPLPFKDWSE